MPDKNQQSPDFIGIGAMKAATTRIFQYLQDVCRDDIEKLEELIGEDLSIWK
jgi:hypothetical protein